MLGPQLSSDPINNTTGQLRRQEWGGDLWESWREPCLSGYHLPPWCLSLALWGLGWILWRKRPFSFSNPPLTYLNPPHTSRACPKNQWVGGPGKLSIALASDCLRTSRQISLRKHKTKISPEVHHPRQERLKESEMGTMAEQAGFSLLPGSQGFSYTLDSSILSGYTGREKLLAGSVLFPLVLEIPEDLTISQIFHKIYRKIRYQLRTRYGPNTCFISHSKQ